MNKKNLRKLADYLMALPNDYENFDMGNYCDEYDAPSDLEGKTIHTCGTAGCAIGHAPEALGVYAYENDWGYFCDRHLIKEYVGGWWWCFSDDWMIVDNTHQGAAKRIYHMLEHGIPDEWDYNEETVRIYQ